MRRRSARLEGDLGLPFELRALEVALNGAIQARQGRLGSIGSPMGWQSAGLLSCQCALWCWVLVLVPLGQVRRADGGCKRNTTGDRSTVHAAALVAIVPFSARGRRNYLSRAVLMSGRWAGADMGAEGAQRGGGARTGAAREAGARAAPAEHLTASSERAARTGPDNHEAA